MKTLRIEYFAVLREHAGKAAEELQTEAATADQLYAELAARHSFPNLQTVKVAINDEFADWSAPLADGDAVVFHSARRGRVILMLDFRISESVLQPDAWRAELADPACGGYATFEGWVRNSNEGHDVLRLEYQVYAALALKEGQRIIAAAADQFPISHALCVHRVGALEIGDLAVWVAVSAGHRDEAFRACRLIIDEIKHRVPIWKKEHYVNGDSGWVNCEACAAGHNHD